MKQNPSAPPELYLSPPLIPVAVASPTIAYEYRISIRTCWCYNEIFYMEKKHNKWKLSMLYEANAYQIPTTKSSENITQILNSLGVENHLYKVEVYSKDIKVNKKYFINLSKLVEYIIQNEKVIEGVVFC